jgi:hypothetical protein
MSDGKTLSPLERPGQATLWFPMAAPSTLESTRERLDG